MTDLERIGGEATVERVITAFIDRVFDDMIIGFMFIGKDKQRIIRHEIEHALQHLGGKSSYLGRPIPAVHRPLPISHGHFRRRIALLKVVLQENEIPPPVIERWVQANQRLESAVVQGGDCLLQD